MCIKRITLTQWLVLLALLGMAFSARADAMGDVISLAPGGQKVLAFHQRVTKVATSDPDVADVTVSGSRELLVTGKKQGAATLSVWLRGEAKPKRSSLIVAKTAGGKLPFGTQVQTNIRIMEVSRSQLNKMGFYYGNTYNNGNNAIGISPPGGGGYRGIPGVDGAVGSNSLGGLGSDGFNLFGLGLHSLAIIEALESGGFAYTLAQPSLTCLSGQTASFLSGGEFPVPTRSDVSGTQVTFKKFGVGLTLTPTVISADQIILKVAAEVSGLDFSSGVESGGVRVPGIRVRRAETTVSLAPGETFIIGGLVSRNTINNSDRVPGLGDIPILGAFFRSSKIQSKDKEMIMVVTPHLVSPGQASSAPPPMPGEAYYESGISWWDMATQTGSGTQPLKHGFSW